MVISTLLPVLVCTVQVQVLDYTALYISAGEARAQYKYGKLLTTSTGIIPVLVTSIYRYMCSRSTLNGTYSMRIHNFLLLVVGYR